jgi:hypothetical protein
VIPHGIHVEPGTVHEESAAVRGLEHIIAVLECLQPIPA